MDCTFTSFYLEADFLLRLKQIFWAVISALQFSLLFRICLRPEWIDRISSIGCGWISPHEFFWLDSSCHPLFCKLFNRAKAWLSVSISVERKAANNLSCRLSGSLPLLFFNLGRVLVYKFWSLLFLLFLEVFHDRIHQSFLCVLHHICDRFLLLRLVFGLRTLRVKLRGSISNRGRELWILIHGVTSYLHCSSSRFNRIWYRLHLEGKSVRVFIGIGLDWGELIIN